MAFVRTIGKYAVLTTNATGGLPSYKVLSCVTEYVGSSAVAARLQRGPPQHSLFLFLRSVPLHASSVAPWLGSNSLLTESPVWMQLIACASSLPTDTWRTCGE